MEKWSRIENFLNRILKKNYFPFMAESFIFKLLYTIKINKFSEYVLLDVENPFFGRMVYFTPINNTSMGYIDTNQHF